MVLDSHQRAGHKSSKNLQFVMHRRGVTAEGPA